MPDNMLESLGGCLRVCVVSCSGLTELVFVSHVINPCHFYIRRYSQKKEAFALQKKLENFCCNKSSYLLPSDILELGKWLISKGLHSLKYYLAIYIP